MTLPAVVTVLDKIVHPKSVHVQAHRRDARVPRRRPLRRAHGHHGRQEEAAGRDEAGELAPDAALKVKYGAAELPPKRAAGVKVKDVKELVTKLKTEAKVI